MIYFIRCPYLLSPFVVALVLFIVLAGQNLCRATDAPSLNSRIIEEQKKIIRLKKGIEEQKSRVVTTNKQERSLLTELDRLNINIKNESGKLARTRKELADHERLIAVKQSEAARAKEAKEQTSSHLKKRLKALYQMGEIGILNVLFSNNELPDLLAFREYFSVLLRRDQEILRKYREEMETLDKIQIDLNQEKQTLLKTIDRLKGQEKQLADTREERIQLLQKVKSEKQLYHKALAELESAADRLTRTLEQLKNEAAKADRKTIRPASPIKTKPGLTSFARQKGRLSPPVPGTVTTRFGKSVQKKFGISTFANGIDIKTAPGTKITAIYEGKVIYAKFLRGYGNLLIIDHGEQYFSLVSRAEKFYKEEGDKVARGEVVGIMSDQEGLLGEGLHFEIRHGTKPENPLLWVNNSRLTIKKASQN